MMAEQRDVTDVVVFMSEEKVGEIIHALSPEQRRFTSIFADTVKQPHEIWQARVASVSVRTSLDPLCGIRKT
jgi:hypothetical protein